MVYEYSASAPTAGTVYVYGINLISSRDSSGNEKYYLYNAHGDVVQLVNGSGVVVKSYSYDAFGVEYDINDNDVNPFRYAGQYFDKETGTIYLRARYFNPANGRFTQADTHWNTRNMIYGDNPQKINERKDELGLNIYTYIPNNNAIKQSGNLYVYGNNNPVIYVDVEGKFVITTAALLIAGGALLFGTIGGLKGNKAANANNARGWEKAKYIATGVAIGGVIGAILGAAAAPAVVSATGVAGISVTAAGVTTVAAAGTTFGSLGTLLANNPGIDVMWDKLDTYAQGRMVERGITQEMVNVWVQTGKVLEQGANKLVYITKEGVAILTRAGQLVTTYTKADFDANMLDIIKRLFG